MGAHAIVTLMNGKYETCDEARKWKISSSLLLKYCLVNFSNIAYITDFIENALASQESTNIL
jgi:penicillin V acylase-like amidase (Ntn superfamily)